MTKPRTRPEAAKPARAREARPKAPKGGPMEYRLTAPGARAGAKTPPGMVTVTRKVGGLSETFTGTVADLRRLGVVKPT